MFVVILLGLFLLRLNLNIILLFLYVLKLYFVIGFFGDFLIFFNWILGNCFFLVDFVLVLFFFFVVEELVEWGGIDNDGDEILIVLIKFLLEVGIGGVIEIKLLEVGIFFRVDDIDEEFEI